MTEMFLICKWGKDRHTAAGEAAICQKGKVWKIKEWIKFGRKEEDQNLMMIDETLL